MLKVMLFIFSFFKYVYNKMVNINIEQIKELANQLFRKDNSTTLIYLAELS